MNKTLNLYLIELAIILVLGGITLVEITNFDLFEKFFDYIKTPSAWFVGISIAYTLSSFIQKRFLDTLSKKFGDEENKEDFFLGFVITLMITSLMTPPIRDIARYFFTDFFIYFHVILMQSVMLLYVFFKLKGNYEISGKYFIT